MILRDLELIFVHIPRTGGTSVEAALTGSVRSPSSPPDYSVGWGWCDERAQWLQHLTLAEMRDSGLITDTELRSFLKVAVVRDPFDRAVSDYFKLRAQLGPRGSFREMLDASGAWSSILTDRSGPHYRGDHIREQLDFVTVDGRMAIDLLGRFETLSDFWSEVRSVRPDLPVQLPSHNVGARSKRHYSLFYSDSEVKAVEGKYARDLDYFGYHFEDHRSEYPVADRWLARARTEFTARADATRRRVRRRRPKRSMS